MLRWISLLPPAIDMTRPFRKFTAGALPAVSSAGQAIPVRPAISMARSEEHTSELQSLMRIPYAVRCLLKNNITYRTHRPRHYDHDEDDKQPTYTPLSSP